MKRASWAVMGVVGLLACTEARLPPEAGPEPLPPPAVVEERPAPPPPTPVQEQPPPAQPPPSGSLMHEVVRSEGGCGVSERVHLSPAALGRMVAASPGARVLVLEDPATRRPIVFHPASGRATHARGEVAAISPDERRVLLWDAAYDAEHGVLSEVDAVSGTTRLPVAAKVARPWLYPDRVHVGLYTEEGRTLVHSLESGSTSQVAGPSTWGFGSVTLRGVPLRVLAGEGTGFVVWDATSGERWAVPDATAARLLEDGSGAVYVDGENRAWGWTPAHPPVRLGVYSHAYHYHRTLYLPVPTPDAAGELYFVGSDHKAVVWNVRAGTVAAATESTRAARQPGGTHLLFNRRLPEGGLALVLRQPTDGSERILLRTAGSVSGMWNAQGDRIAVLEYPEWDSERFVVRLFRSPEGEELALQPALSGSGFNEHPGLFFADEGRILHVSSEGSDAFYATEDGVQRYVTRRASVPAEGHNYYWGPDGVFYGRQGGYMGPPDGGLFTWNPRTGEETELGTGTMTVCFLGPHHLFQHDPPYRRYEAGPLSSWVSATGARQQLSANAHAPACAARAGGVIFWEPVRPANTPSGLSGTLVFASPERACRQTLAEDVLEFWVSEDHILLFAESGVWRASHPAGY